MCSPSTKKRTPWQNSFDSNQEGCAVAQACAGSSCMGGNAKKNSSDVAAGVERKRFQNLGGWSDDYPQYPVEVLNRAVIRLRCV
jgi:hypothetical protein